MAPYTRTKILATADQCVNGDRDHDYGGPERSFDTIAAMWNAYIAHATGANVDLGADDVAAMMALLKIVRIARNPEKMDSWIDLAGYAACGGEIASVNNGVAAEDDGTRKATPVLTSAVRGIGGAQK